MSLDEFDRTRLESAIASTRHPIPLNSIRQLDVEGVIAVLQATARARDEYRAEAVLEHARLDRARWEIECLQKDVANEQRRLAEMTEYRDNASSREEMAKRERDEARAEIARLKKPTPKRSNG